METVSPVHRLPGVLPGLLLGLGLGGLLDGLVLVQVLHWHHLLGATASHPLTTVAGLRAHARADGVFEVVAGLVALAGGLTTYDSWRHGRPAPNGGSQVGLLLAGCGVYVLLDSLVLHGVLGLHHVRDDLGGPSSWDLGFAALGVLLVLLGAQLYRLGRRQEHSVVQVRPALATIEAISVAEQVEDRA